MGRRYGPRMHETTFDRGSVGVIILSLQGNSGIGSFENEMIL